MRLYMMEERMYTLDIFEDYDDLVWMVEEPLWKGITVELKELHDLKGASFIKKLKQIVFLGEFHPVDGEMGIYSTVGEQSPDYNRVFRKRYEK